MRARWTVGLVICAIALAGDAARAQPSDPAREARTVVDAFYAATNARRWAEAVTYLDLPAFEEYFKEVVSSARSDLPRPQMTVEELMAQDTTKPRAVAEWEVARMQKYTTRVRFHDFSHQFTGVTSFRELQTLTPAEAAARWLEAQDPRTEIRQWILDPPVRCPGEHPAIDTTRVFEIFKRKSIGAAAVDDSTVYVLTVDGTWQLNEADSYVPDPGLVRVLRTSTGWRIRHKGDLLSGTSSFGSGCN